MKKLLMCCVLLVSSMVADAQLGITREGKPTRLYIYSPYDLTSAIEPGRIYGLSDRIYGLSDGLPAPKYLKGAKSVTVFGDSYNVHSIDSVEYKKIVTIYFDPVGRVIKTNCYSYDDEYVYDYEYVYEGNRLSKIYETHNGKTDKETEVNFYYDSHGHLSKIKSGLKKECHVSWTPQGYLQKVRYFVCGNEDNYSPWNFNITQNGTRMLINDLDEYLFDKHSIVKKNISYHIDGTLKRRIHISDNTYDENGNLSMQIESEMRDIGKYEVRRIYYKYEYDFGAVNTSSETKKEPSIVKEQQRKEEDLRVRKEAEARARESEKRDVAIVVNGNIVRAREYMAELRLDAAAGMLQRSLDTIKLHNYDYRKSEITQLLDSIGKIRSRIANDPMAFNYKRHRPDQYMATDEVISKKLKEHIVADGKNVSGNMSITLNTNDKPGSFQLEEPSINMERFCEEILTTVKLQPFVVDGKALNASATYDYYYEYFDGMAKVRLSYGNPKVNIKAGKQFADDIDKAFSDRLTSSSSQYNGNYKFHVTAIDINGQMSVSMKLKGVRCDNGPQNTWKSVLVPGWGDKYVDGEKRFDWWKTVISYGAIALGTSMLVFPDHEVYLLKMSGRQDVKFGDLGLGIPLVAIGGGQWLYDVIHVWYKGNKNKESAKSAIQSRTSSSYRVD